MVYEVNEWMMETSPWDGQADRGEVSVLTRGAQAPVVMSERNCWGGRRSRSRVGLPLLELPTSHTTETRGQCQRASGPQLREDAGCLTLSGRSERDQPSLAQSGTHLPPTPPLPLMRPWYWAGRCSREGSQKGQGALQTFQTAGAEESLQESPHRSPTDWTTAAPEPQVSL